MNEIKVFLADDHTIVRKGLRSLLEEESDLVVVGEAENGRDAVAQILQLKPDVVVMDVGMPELNGLEATRQLIATDPNAKILLLTVHANEEYIFEAIKAGASAYLLKRSAPCELVNAIRLALKGESYFCAQTSTKIAKKIMGKQTDSVSPHSLSTLTGREREVLQLVAEGYTNKEIGEKLHLSLKTIKTHRFKLMGKLDIHNTADLTKYAIKHGLIDLDSLF